jgi:hypothetical protein
MKSGPALNAATCMPRRRRERMRPAVTTVFPTPLVAPAMTKRGMLGIGGRTQEMLVRSIYRAMERR